MKMGLYRALKKTNISKLSENICAFQVFIILNLWIKLRLKQAQSG